MGIKIDTPIIIAQSAEWKISAINIAKNIDKGFVASVLYELKDSFGKRIDSKYLGYVGSSFDSWWDDFDSIQFLYDNLSTDKGLPKIIDPNIEDEFKNALTDSDIDPLPMPVVQEVPE